MGCFCAVPEEFYCEVLLLDESKLTLTTQQQGIKVSVQPVLFSLGLPRHLSIALEMLCLVLSNRGQILLETLFRDRAQERASYQNRLVSNYQEMAMSRGI